MVNPAASDTSREAERMLVAGYRLMSPAEKLRRVVSLNRTLEQLARARIRRDYGEDVAAREVRLRLAALRLDRQTMVKAFDWDPLQRGY